MTKRKDTKVKVDITGKGTNGAAIGLIDIYNVLCDIRSMMTEGGAPKKATGSKEPEKTEPEKVSRKKTKAEKDAIKAELLKGMPYDEQAVKLLSGPKVRMLGAALGLKTFGIHPDKIRNEILAAGKKASKASPKKDGKGKADPKAAAKKDPKAAAKKDPKAKK